MTCVVCGSEDFIRIDNRLCSCKVCKTVVANPMDTEKFMAILNSQTEAHIIFIETSSITEARKIARKHFSDNYYNMEDGEIEILNLNDIKILRD